MTDRSPDAAGSARTLPANAKRLATGAPKDKALRPTKDKAARPGNDKGQ